MSTSLSRWLGRRAEGARRRGWNLPAATLGRLALRLDDDAEMVRQTLALAVLSGDDYRRVLEALHQARTPRCYVEIGVRHGETLALAHAETDAIGIDPSPRVDRVLGPRTEVFPETSDDFFRRWSGRPALSGRTIDLAFIDGLHLFEQVLRDFIHVEERSAPEGLIVVHDVWPADRRTAARAADPSWWTGDVWKLIPALRRHRPDLRLVLARSAPTGLLLVSNLSPGSPTLETSFEHVVSESRLLDFPDFAQATRTLARGAPRTTVEVLRALALAPTGGAAP